jgi:hypothetical protein
MNFDQYAQMLRQYLGSMGCKASMLDYEELLEVSKLAFDMPGTNLIALAVKVKALGPNERSARVREAIRKHWPEPTILWPAQGNARKLLAKEIRP